VLIHQFKTFYTCRQSSQSGVYFLNLDIQYKYKVYFLKFPFTCVTWSHIWCLKELLTCGSITLGTSQFPYYKQIVSWLCLKSMFHSFEVK
jgi:hypothetical protein